MAKASGSVALNQYHVVSSPSHPRSSRRAASPERDLPPSHALPNGGHFRRRTGSCVASSPDLRRLTKLWDIDEAGNWRRCEPDTRHSFDADGLVARGSRSELVTGARFSCPAHADDLVSAQSRKAFGAGWTPGGGPYVNWRIVLTSTGSELRARAPRISDTRLVPSPFD